MRPLTKFYLIVCFLFFAINFIDLTKIYAAHNSIDSKDHNFDKAFFYEAQ